MVLLLQLSNSLYDCILPSVNGVKTGPYLFGAGVWFPKMDDISRPFKIG